MLTQAKHVFEDSGFLEARISDIAERAGLSHGSFYHYFESKEEVFLEVDHVDPITETGWSVLVVGMALVEVVRVAVVFDCRVAAAAPVLMRVAGAGNETR